MLVETIGLIGSQDDSVMVRSQLLRYLLIDLFFFFFLVMTRGKSVSL